MRYEVGVLRRPKPVQALVLFQVLELDDAPLPGDIVKGDRLAASPQLPPAPGDAGALSGVPFPDGTPGCPMIGDPDQEPLIIGNQINTRHSSRVFILRQVVNIPPPAVDLETLFLKQRSFQNICHHFAWQQIERSVGTFEIIQMRNHISSFLVFWQPPPPRDLCSRIVRLTPVTACK